ncbi:hypothetical protein NEFER03_1201 [Nematocida sp. LUAm3]|nr:hypothetical protein NEFER03_1201 [Nematocida sp. LUAm3]KAI5175810.1 hypothetical protein NEFER02_1679 [Nematocida sp. LUAm2]KAI5178306.1 hypothetical protein NEFER01_1473 [Nematocida sp. LUAm1]
MDTQILFSFTKKKHFMLLGVYFLLSLMQKGVTLHHNQVLFFLEENQKGFLIAFFILYNILPLKEIAFIILGQSYISEAVKKKHTALIEAIEQRRPEKEIIGRLCEIGHALYRSAKEISAFQKTYIYISRVSMFIFIVCIRFHRTLLLYTFTWIFIDILIKIYTQKIFKKRMDHILEYTRYLSIALHERAEKKEEKEYFQKERTFAKKTYWFMAMESMLSFTAKVFLHTYILFSVMYLFNETFIESASSKYELSSNVDIEKEGKSFFSMNGKIEKLSKCIIKIF